MKTTNVMKLGLGLVALAVTIPGMRAQAPTPASSAKVAIINIQGAILATKDGEKARNDIQAKFASRAKEMEGRQAEIQKLRDQFQKGSNTLGQEQRDKLSRDIDDKTKRFQWDSEDLQNEVQQEEQKLVNDIGQRMVTVIDEIAKEKTLAIVLDVSSQQSPVLWAANGIDLTREAVERYDKKFGVTSGAPGSAAPAATTPAGTTPAGSAVRPILPTPAPKPPVAAPKKP